MSRRPLIDPARIYLRSHGLPEHVLAGGLERLVSDWERTARRIAEGATFDQDDYLNDMDGRRILAEVLERVPVAETAAARARTAAADAEARAHLVPTTRCIWGVAAAARRLWTPEREWWYFHRPRALDASWGWSERE